MVHLRTPWGPIPRRGAFEVASVAQIAGDRRRPFPQYFEALYSWMLVAWPGPMGQFGLHPFLESLEVTLRQGSVWVNH